MNGLPRAEPTIRPANATQVMLFGMVEAMTMKLRRGDPVDADTCRTIEGFCSRADALRAAYDSRVALIDKGDEE